MRSVLVVSATIIALPGLWCSFNGGLGGDDGESDYHSPGLTVGDALS